FRAFGPSNGSCSGSTQYEATVPVAGNGDYSPGGFSPSAGLYRWTASYAGDANNEAAELVCNAPNQASAVGTVAVTLTARNATNNTVGAPVTATASIANGAIPTGKITFRAFPPADGSCSGSPAFSSTVSAAGNASYTSAPFTPSRVGTFRWTVSYSGDANHAPAGTSCGAVTSNVIQARPTISSGVQGRGAVGRSFQVTATLTGGYAPTGTVTFQIYDQTKTVAGCARLLATNTVPVAGNGTVSSAPYVPRRPARYSFAASYSGDAQNQAATEPCDPTGHAAQVLKRRPKVTPRARLIGGGRRISVRAQLSGAASPSGMLSFRLYRPGDVQCRRHPAFAGGVSVKSNGRYLLGQFVAGRSGIYRLSVSYSGDQRNRRYTGSCGDAQPIRVR
ncbi:MAG TPA: Ig-like domain-containing protein, partial [Solirubrobacterales bacterium]